MKIQHIDDGGWFDLESATRFEEDTWWNGNNHISVATGAQWDHQVMFMTRKGAFILSSWSQRQGAGESWRIVPREEAADWLIKNRHALPESLAELAAGMER